VAFAARGCPIRLRLGIGTLGLPGLTFNGIGGTASGAVGLVGGNCNDSLKCGVRCANFNRTAGNAIWYFGAAQSYTIIGIDSTLSALVVLLWSALLAVIAGMVLIVAFAART